MSRFHVGDHVVINYKPTPTELSKCHSEEFQNNWIPEMDRRVEDGVYYRVDHVSKFGVALSNAVTGALVTWRFPPLSMRLMRTGELTDCHNKQAAFKINGDPKSAFKGPVRPLKPGDRVRIVRKAPDKIKGEFENTWVSEMDKLVGGLNVYVVTQVEAAGVKLEVNETNHVTALGCWWPPACFELMYGDPLAIEPNTSTTTPTTTSEEDSMNLKIENRTYINGSNATEVKDETLIDLISQAEAEIERLQKLNTKSTAIAARIVALTEGADTLAKLLDSRAA